jgi:alkanesulfonate monooxygenase SsuD/methylene tetrahydromethanopterin reductase-like flavin-dependent oxidoreductase (luciferase family)
MRLRKPELSVAVGVVCAETDEEAERLSSSWRMAITQAGRNEFGPLPAVPRALAFIAREQGDTFAGRRVVVGSPGTVRAELDQIAADYTADEALVHTLVHNHGARMRCYELLADAFELRPARTRRPRHASGRR